MVHSEIAQNRSAGAGTAKKYNVIVTRQFLQMRERGITNYTAFYGSRKLRKKLKFANFFRNFPHVRSLWEQKVAKKVWKLSLSTIIARSGAKVCKLFALQMWQKKVARRKKYRFGVRQNHELFSRVTQPIQSVVHNHTREPHTTHTTPNMDGHG